jgi:hypothetical protein
MSDLSDGVLLVLLCLLGLACVVPALVGAYVLGAMSETERRR